MTAFSEGSPSSQNQSPSSIETSKDSFLYSPSEELFFEELKHLKAYDRSPKPQGWLLSPLYVVHYLMGGELEGKYISPKYIGPRSLIEVAVATLATDRALLLLGVPGTAKSWVSEHLAAAISGQSTLLIQGTAGTDEEHLRYGWNYASLLAKGPHEDALVPSPLFRGMQEGKLVRLEELTRMSAEVQDSLITLLSEKMMPIVELNQTLRARAGFNIIATANHKDQGVHELSAALKRRFNVVILPLPDSLETEVQIVNHRLADLTSSLKLPPLQNQERWIEILILMFRELRSGETFDGMRVVKQPSSTLSTAELLSTLLNMWSHAVYFKHPFDAPLMASHVYNTVIKDPIQDPLILQEYVEGVVKTRTDWNDVYQALKELI